MLIVSQQSIIDAQITTKLVKCERFSVPDHVWITQLFNACFMDSETTIDSKGFTISNTNEKKILGLQFTENKKNHFLPENVNEVLPDLEKYDTDVCSIKEINYKKFKGLAKLTGLSLTKNQIEIIENAAFKDLTLLRKLYLRKKNSKTFFLIRNNFFVFISGSNKIIKINGKAFARLNMLSTVDLKTNVCVNKYIKQDFKGSTLIVDLQGQIPSAFAFDEPAETI
jgi:hypothetical protein